MTAVSAVGPEGDESGQASSAGASRQELDAVVAGREANGEGGDKEQSTTDKGKKADQQKKRGKGQGETSAKGKGKGKGKISKAKAKASAKKRAAKADDDKIQEEEENAKPIKKRPAATLVTKKPSVTEQLDTRDDTDEEPVSTLRDTVKSRKFNLLYEMNQIAPEVKAAYDEATYAISPGSSHNQ